MNQIPTKRETKPIMALSIPTPARLVKAIGVPRGPMGAVSLPRRRQRRQ
jgi:hypothetical protein